MVVRLDLYKENQDPSMLLTEDTLKIMWTSEHVSTNQTKAEVAEVIWTG